MTTQTPSRFRLIAPAAAFLLIVLTVAACGESEETPLRSVSFEAQMQGDTSFETDEGYEVVITDISLAARDFVFTAGGEAHLRDSASVKESTSEGSSIDTAFHPGHIQGGQVLGEYPGEHLIELSDGATFTTGEMFSLSSVSYDAVNFGFFRTAALSESASPDLSEGSAVVSGTVTVDDVSKPFRFEVVMDDDDQVLGVPFDVEVPGSGAVSVRFEFHPVDPFEGDTLFDGIDFSGLASSEGVMVITPETTAYNRVRNALRSHDHYVFSHSVE